MSERKQLSVSEVRRTIATSLAAAFGFVIALLWTNVVLGGIKVAGINLDVAPTLTEWLSFVGLAVLLTVVMIVLIVVISRWSGKQ